MIDCKLGYLVWQGQADSSRTPATGKQQTQARLKLAIHFVKIQKCSP